MLWGAGCLLAVAPQQPRGLLAQGSRYKGWGLLWGMKLTLGNVSIPFHNPVERHVGGRACLPGVSCPPQRPMLSPRAGTSLGHLS